MTKDNLINHIFNHNTAETLPIPPKTILLEEGKIADRIYLIRKGCLRLFFYNEGKDITLTACTKEPQAYFHWKALNRRKSCI